MSEWVIVNGAKIDKEFFEQNLAEAKPYKWFLKKWSRQGEHTHCMICNISIPENPPKETVFYQSQGGCLCSFCFDNFIKNKNSREHTT